VGETRSIAVSTGNLSINYLWTSRRSPPQASLYDQRRQTLVQSLFSHFGDQVKILGDNAGMHLMIKIDTALTDEEIVQRAAQVGVGINAAYPYYLKTSPGSEFVLGYAELNEQQIQEGIRRLAQTI
jgi:GntR family transcriptional regulator/MocR family aminotransferase